MTNALSDQKGHRAIPWIIRALVALRQGAQHGPRPRCARRRRNRSLPTAKPLQQKNTFAHASQRADNGPQAREEQRMRRRLYAKRPKRSAAMSQRLRDMDRGRRRDQLRRPALVTRVAKADGAPRKAHRALSRRWRTGTRDGGVSPHRHPMSFKSRRAEEAEEDCCQLSRACPRKQLRYRPRLAGFAAELRALDPRRRAHSRFEKAVRDPTGYDRRYALTRCHPNNQASFDKPPDCPL